MIVIIGIAVFAGCALDLASGKPGPAACCVDIGDYIADTNNRCILFQCVYGVLPPGETVYPLIPVIVGCPAPYQTYEGFVRGRHDILTPCRETNLPCERESPLPVLPCPLPGKKTRCYDCIYNEAIVPPYTACKNIWGGLAKPVCPKGVCFVRRKEGPDGKTIIRRGCANDYPKVDTDENCVIPPADYENRTWTFCSGDLCNDQPYRTVTENGQEVEKDPVEYECGL